MRRHRAERREILPDPKYQSRLVAKFINTIMERGKRSLAERIVYHSFALVQERLKTPESTLEVFQKAIENARPQLELKSRRVGGATYQIPIEVPKERGIAIALRWLRDFAKARKGKQMTDKLTEELIDAYRGQGLAVKRKEEIHKMAEANRAFSHYRW